MEFEFDTRKPKLIKGTWKGIPRCMGEERKGRFISNVVRKHKDVSIETKLSLKRY